jgi:molybdopterin synthase sulfur carrier subunit
LAQVHFTSWLREFVPNGPVEAEGETVGAALAAVFGYEPQVRGYVLDERGQLRKHVCVFADGMRLANGLALQHPIGPQSKLYVMQALSGG